MIGTIRHKGLRKLFEDDDPSGLNPEHVRKIRQILAVMDAAEQVEQLDLPTFRLHQLRADLRGFWSMTVRSNWRIVFRFEDGRATDVDLVDYH
ncbi:MAG: type II toxin-antitoxin system RelE/ParE family toxin [Beijerinckiaceae bacterium]